MAANNPLTPGGSPIITEEPSFPGFGRKKIDTKDFNNYSVRYAKIDMDDPASRLELESLETRAIQDRGIVVLTKDKFTFMDKYFMIVSYLELNENADTSR
ncbi:hypothetical protein D3C87_279840 [compost metagenome]